MAQNRQKHVVQSENNYKDWVVYDKLCIISFLYEVITQHINLRVLQISTQSACKHDFHFYMRECVCSADNYYTVLGM